MTTYIVSVYLCDRAYGGPEEGGWYYECGTPSEEHIEHLQIFDDWQEAKLARDQLQTYLDDAENANRPSIDSVLSQGVYRAIVDENELPKPYPKERPYYE